MASAGNDDDQNQECKCYKVVSVKPIADKEQVFDMLATFLQNDRKHQQSTITHDDGVRQKASWNELRRWANSLLTEHDDGDESNRGNEKRRRPIDDWKHDQHDSDDEDEQEYEDEMEDEHRRISEGIVKMEAAEVTNRAEVAIAGRSADESFVDHVPDEMEGGDIVSDGSKEEKRARKKARKEAKKAKKEKKQAKKEKKSSKKIKTEA
ncbi:MAG: hypothetical protein SGILL_002534 [Bacillariaceae sp.]